MTRKTSFHFYKWYADLIDEKTDDVTIVYMGEVEWKSFKLSFTNIVQFLEKHHLISHATFSNYQPPVWKNEFFRMENLGQWQSKENAIREKLFENKDGYILWECFMPNAYGEMRINEKVKQGLGYVERLTMTLKPWQIPIKILRWGRFLTDQQTIIWIRWEGEEERFLIFHNEKKYLHGMINDEYLQFGNYRLSLAEKYILRHGPLIKTVFDRFLWVKKIFPSGIFDMNECKWQTWSELYENDRCIARGWSIHENVDCKPKTNVLGKIFYGSLFAVLLPLIFIIWAKRTEDYVHLPIPTNSVVAIIGMGFGMMFIILAMLELWIKGDGLPMNAYPPPKLVTTGVYRLISHPIYIGTSIFSYSLSVYWHSKSGFWLISPILTLAWLALVYGYENEDLKIRFPNTIWKPSFTIPENIPVGCQWRDILTAYGLVLIPWLILYQTVIFIGPPLNPISTYLSFEDDIPVIEWTEFFYLLTYPYVACLPLILQTKQQIRSFVITGLMNISIGIYCQLIFPLVAIPREFIPRTILGEILFHEREYDGPNGAFPSFHVSWALISGYYYALRFPQWKLLFYLLSSSISASCITTGMHSILDVVGGMILFFLCIYREKLWINIRNYLEELANSWSAYRIGSLRIINHSYYAFFSIFSGLLIICSFLGHTYAPLVVSFCSLVCGAIWAQWIEKPSRLSRPFGYFGCIIGGIIGSIIASWYFSIPIIKILSTYALASPWIQGTGRLRCIVQGCCHGRPTNPYLGIIITNPRSRVCTLSQLKNTYIHITAAYSILANLLIGMFLCRLWYSNVALNLILGLYFILIGLSRFVEETFRGEIQTPIYYKLKIYQWMSILFVLIGIVISMIPCDQGIRLQFSWNWEYLIPAGGFGLVTACVVGVDLPESNRRFSRLSD